jgi:von Willebrand factor type A domain
LRTITLILGAAFVIGIPAQGQTDSCLDRTVTVSVADKDGLHVTGLKPSDFKAHMWGGNLRVASATQDTKPRRMVLLLDTSDSVTAPTGEWKNVLAVAKEIVTLMPSHVSIAITTFSSRSHVVSDFSDDRATKLSKLAALEGIDWVHQEDSKNTALLDAIASALALLRPAQSGDTIFLLTDGGDNASMEKTPALARELLESDVRVFGLIGFPPPLISAVAPPPQPAEVRLIPDAIPITGGQHAAFRWVVKGPLADGLMKNVLASAARFVLAISYSYRLELVLDRRIDSYKRWQLDVKQGSAKRTPHYIAFPQRLAPCN